jgi:hypothetical protein
MYTMTLATPLSTVSINLWNEAGQPNKPIGDVTNSNCPTPGMVKAVNFLCLGSNGICQNPDVKSKVEKIVDPDRPISPMHSLISFIEYLSGYDLLFSSLKS